MGRYAAEPDNATKAAKARGSNLRVHFKVIKKYLFFGFLHYNLLKLIAFFWIEIHKKKEGDCFEELKGGHFVIMVRKPPRYFNKSSCNPSRTPEKRLKPLRRCLFIVLPLIWKTSSNRRKSFPFVDSWVVLVVMPKLRFMELPRVVGLRNPPNSCCTW